MDAQRQIPQKGIRLVVALFHGTETKEEIPNFVELFTINPGLGGKAPILGQDPVNRGNRPSYLMLKAGCWGKQKVQLHRFYG